MPQNLEQIPSELLFNKKTSTNETIFSILHFNDVYNIESNSTEPKAGAARFLTALKYLKEQSNPMPSLVLFSGDAFSPSALSLITKGRQMVTCLNQFGIHGACIGNHDFDFGVDILTDLIKETNFPWLISNVLDIKTKQPLAKAESKHIIEIANLKIGLIGLVEREWIETLSTIGYEDVIYESFVTVGSKLAKELKTIDKVDYVIALTHMRLPNDVKLAREVDNINIILGGHDHNYCNQLVNKTWLIKSGTDFRNLTRIELGKNDLAVTRIEKYTIDSTVAEDEELKLIVDSFSKLENKEFDLDVLAKVNIDLDSRFVVVRSQESNIANLICDILLDFLPAADCCIVNSGTFRSDCINPSGIDFTLGDLKKSKVILEALENSVSTYPKLEGRFPQVAGIHFTFDSSKEPNSRIDPKNVRIRETALDLNKQDYKVVVKAYMREGKDGFHVLSTCTVLVDEDQTPLVFTIIENYFRKKRNHIENFSIEPIIEKRIVAL